MAKIEFKVCVVTVTYGDRWKFLEQVLKRVLTFKNVSHVIVVDNASHYNVSAAIQNLNVPEIQVISEKENLGSAGGYKGGISKAITLDIDFLWLLDDDNLPDKNTLEVLLHKWPITPGIESKKALFCLREDRKQLIKIAQGENPYRYYLVPNNFLGFSFFNIVPNQFKKIRDRFKTSQVAKAAKLPFSPYGGLLLPKTLAIDIGLPNDLFYLYVDDTEYTYRITEREGSIWLIPDCKIIDIDKSQGTGYKNTLLRSVLLDQWSFRTYYHVRNMLFFNKKAIKNIYLFSINKNLYLTGLYLMSIWGSKQAEHKQLLEAINDGLKGNLGKKQF
ncbi:MAG: glycosyltransferase [Pyrinomonadaceae bacterium]|nr:glycosyltransferase [Sphingobacteriaceae bacterium]